MTPTVNNDKGKDIVKKDDANIKNSARAESRHIFASLRRPPTSVHSFVEAIAVLEFQAPLTEE